MPTTKYIDMKFSVNCKELGGLTEDQVFELAKFGKGVLEHAGGMFCLSSGLLGLVKDALKADDFDFEENKLTIEALLHVVGMVDDLRVKCWGERKTPLGLLGLQTDNDFFGLGETTNIQAL